MSMGRNRDQPWSYRYYEITLSCPAWVRAQLAFRGGDDLGVGRPSIYTTASGVGNLQGPPANIMNCRMRSRSGLSVAVPASAKDDTIRACSGIALGPMCS